MSYGTPMPRPRKSAAQHKAEGTYRKDRHSEPEGLALVALKSVDAPEWIGDLAGTWSAVTIDLCEMGALMPSDLPLLESAFRALSNSRRIQALLDVEIEGGNGDGYDPADLGKLSAAVVSQTSLYSSLFARFGIGPADRAKLLQMIPRIKKDKGKSLDSLLT